MTFNIKGNEKTYELLENLYPVSLSFNQGLSLKKKFLILSIVGGGIRGIIPLVFLCLIELKTSRYISDCFDLIGGTSIGSIITSNLLCPYDMKNKFPKFSAWEILYNMLSKCQSIFPKKFNLFALLGGSRQNTNQIIYMNFCKSFWVNEGCMRALSHY